VYQKSLDFVVSLSLNSLQLSKIIYEEDMFNL